MSCLFNVCVIKRNSRPFHCNNGPVHHLLLFLVPPEEKEWKKIARDFNKRWQYTNCTGAIDGKHITILASTHTSSAYHKYKMFLSIELMTGVDAWYWFMVNVHK